MKKILFASVIAFAAIFATSCKDKNAGEAPKARFAYVTDGLVVTFTNASKDATEYAWEFGDGSAISKEVNPVHEYAEAGTYTVKLTAKNAAGENAATETITLEAKAFNIVIDGAFEDWENLPEEWLAMAEVDDDATTDGCHVIKFISDADYLYFYMQYSGVEDEVGVLDIFINTDNDATTGFDAWLWSPSGADILMEGGTDIDTETEQELWWPDYFKSLGSTWEDWDAMDPAPSVDMSDIKKLANGDKALEGRIARASIPDFKSCQVGVLVQGPDWSGEVGWLPETHVTEGPAPMLDVKLK
jgi:PKD repeat protein